MEIEAIKKTLHKLEKLMYGYNFEVTFGIEVFVNCYSYEDFAIQLKTVYPEATPNEISPVIISKEELLKDLVECLEYRGDDGAGLILDELQDKTLKDEQAKYLQFIEKFLSQSIHIYAYPNSKGIPGYPVWWDYRYLILSKDGKALFTHGSSSD